ncbi:glycoside hydrolase family 73 protein [Paenibacillus sp. TAF43_2]|uniref:glycoside hydrolase family 73 protein n=1 Tax=Paenibacillus sp. TAF43_2 TaxID=3233069 RepID=UPI003F98594B
MTQLSRADFISKLAPIVQRVRGEGSPLLPSVRLAQNILETGCVIHPWYNLGGIKVGGGKPNGYWKGRSINKGTWEEYGGHTVNTTANFRVYDSLYDFYKDQDLLFQLPRYDRVRAAKTPEGQADMLYKCGYATDSGYASKLIALIRVYNLTKYDVLEEDDNVIKLSDAEWVSLAAAVQRLIDGKVISDKSWLEKVKSKKMTLSELTWLNTIAISRK